MDWSGSQISSTVSSAAEGRRQSGRPSLRSLVHSAHRSPRSGGRRSTALRVRSKSLRSARSARRTRPSCSEASSPPLPFMRASSGSASAAPRAAPTATSPASISSRPTVRRSAGAATAPSRPAFEPGWAADCWAAPMLSSSWSLHQGTSTCSRQPSHGTALLTQWVTDCRTGRFARRPTARFRDRSPLADGRRCAPTTGARARSRAATS